MASVPLLVCIWLVLHALIVQTAAAAPCSPRETPVTRAPPSERVAADWSLRASATPHLDVRSARSRAADARTSLHPGAAGPLDNAVRVARPVTGVIATNGELPAVKLPLVAALANTARPTDAAYTAHLRVRTLDASHAVASRGAVLPYFATAPPLQG